MLTLLACEGEDGKAAARLLLREGLRRVYGLAEFPVMDRGPQGKPFFPDAPHIRFNLSHSGGLALCALSDGEVGVDIELVKPRAPGLPGRVLSDAEYRWYASHGGDWGAFCTLWTRKESWCKRSGTGIFNPRAVLPPLPGEGHETLAVHSFAGDGWRAAACAEKGEKPTILWLGVTKKEFDPIS